MPVDDISLCLITAAPVFNFGAVSGDLVDGGRRGAVSLEVGGLLIIRDMGIGFISLAFFSLWLSRSSASKAPSGGDL